MFLDMSWRLCLIDWFEGLARLKKPVQSCRKNYALTSCRHLVVVPCHVQISVQYNDKHQPLLTSEGMIYSHGVLQRPQQRVCLSAFSSAWRILHFLTSQWVPRRISCLAVVSESLESKVCFLDWNTLYNTSHFFRPLKGPVLPCIALQRVLCSLI